MLMRSRLLETVKGKIGSGEMLVLGTTKSIIVYNVLSKSRELGIDFYTSVHTEFPMIAPFTCVCNPDFGSGFHISTSCFARADDKDIPRLGEVAAGSKTGTKIPCIMYVSSRELASEINHQLEEHFGSQDSLVESLQGINYFN